MSQTPFSLDRFDERARTAIQMPVQTGAMAIVWFVSWKWVAPLLGIQKLDPGDFFQSIASIVAVVTSGGEPSQTVIGTIAGFILWMLPVFVALCGVAAISAALWYAVGRLTSPSVATDTGGDD